MSTATDAAIEKAIQQYNELVDAQDPIRKRLINKLVAAIDKFDLDIGRTSGKDLEGQLAAFTTASALMNHQADARNNAIKAAKAKKSDELGDQSRAIVAEFIRAMTVPAAGRDAGTVPAPAVDTARVEQIIKERVESECAPITDDERHIDAPAPTDGEPGTVNIKPGDNVSAAQD